MHTRSIRRSRHRARSIAAILTVALTTQPLLAWPALRRLEARAPAPPSAPAFIAIAVAPTPANGAAARPSPYFPIAYAPLAVAAPALLQEQRSTIAERLIALGYAPDAAVRMTAELTPDDLAVISANPKMMQKAGEMDDAAWNIVIALIVAGVVVGIVIAANGSIHVH